MKQIKVRSHLRRKPGSSKKIRVHEHSRIIKGSQKPSLIRSSRARGAVLIWRRTLNQENYKLWVHEMTGDRIILQKVASGKWILRYDTRYPSGKPRSDRIEFKNKGEALQHVQRYITSHP